LLSSSAESRAVVITAGALNTPKILMNSGIGESLDVDLRNLCHIQTHVIPLIGDGKKLKQAGIPVVSDLPGVGSNLQDHPGLGITFELSSEMTTVTPGSFSTYIEELQNYKNWVLEGGPTTGGPSARHLLVCPVGLTCRPFVARAPRTFELLSTCQG
jgi:choline dehydrogenase-like flavoprotein